MSFFGSLTHGLHNAGRSQRPALTTHGETHTLQTHFVELSAAHNFDASYVARVNPGRSQFK